MNLKPWTPFNTIANRWRWLAVVGLATALSSCGGGGGIGSSLSSLVSTLTGHAIDAAVPYATVTITSGAPLGDTGATTIGSFTTDSTGAYTGSVTLPSTSVPVFANVGTTITNQVNQGSTNLTMSSYIGQSTTLAAQGTFTSVSTSGSVANLPNLDITPVTTAALAVYGFNNSGNYANLTPTGYASTLQTDGSAVLAIASGIKALGDGLCALPSSVNGTTLSSTTDFANAVTSAIGSAGLSNGTALTTVSQQLTSCVSGFSLTAVSQMIDADAVFGPQLVLGDVIEPAIGTTQPLSTGTYQLQYMLVETGATVTPLSYLNSVPAPYSPSAMPILTISTTGAITSSDSTNQTTVSGNALGNAVNFTITANGHSYTMNGKVAALPTTLYTASAGSVFTLQAAGTNSSTNPAGLIKMEAVLVPWNGSATTANPSFTSAITSSGGQGISCASGQGQPLRMDLMTIAPVSSTLTSLGGSVAECLVTSASSPNWVLNPGTSSSTYAFDDHNGTITSASIGSALNMSQVSGASFMLQGSGNVSIAITSNTNVTTNILTSATATFSYVIGSGDMVFATSSGSTAVNGLLHLQDAIQTSEYASSVTLQPSESSGIFSNVNYNGHGDQYDH